MKGQRRKEEKRMCMCPVGTATKGITCWCYHAQLLLSSSPLYVHWNHLCTVASSEILLGQSVISPGLHSLPPSSPLCAGIICGQVIISEIICYCWDSPSEFLDTSSICFSISLYSLTLDGHEVIGGYGIWLEVRFQA